MSAVFARSRCLLCQLSPRRCICLPKGLDPAVVASNVYQIGKLKAEQRAAAELEQRRQARKRGRKGARR